jgi:hypothetical protein
MPLQAQRCQHINLLCFWFLVAFMNVFGGVVTKCFRDTRRVGPMPVACESEILTLQSN